MSSCFESACVELHDGQISFTDFERATRDRWSSLAQYIARRWKLPCWASIEDVEQELLLGAWNAVWKFDPARATGTIGQYVVWNAVDHAKKKVHRMRGAEVHRNADSNPGRPEKPFAAWGDKAEQKAEVMLRTEAGQEDAFEQAEQSMLALRRARVACQNRVELQSIDAIAEKGDVYAAVLSLYEDADARLECRFKDEEHAAQVVVQAAAAVAARLRVA